MKKYIVMVVSYGFAEVEAESESEALSQCKEMAAIGSRCFDWSDPEDEQVVEEIDY